jgi:hypothetical protein
MNDVVARKLDMSQIQHERLAICYAEKTHRRARMYVAW